MGNGRSVIRPVHSHCLVSDKPAFTIPDSRFSIPGGAAYAATFFAFSTTSSMLPTM